MDQASKLDLVEDIKLGLVTPAEALRKYNLPSTLLADIDLDSMFYEVIPSGFPSLDRMDFLKKDYGELIIVGARPSVGKTAFMSQVGLNVASLGGNVLFYSMEMSKKAIARRMLAQFVQRPIQNSEHLYSAAQEGALDKFKQLPVRIDDRGRLTIEEVMSTALDAHRQKPLDLVCIDYLQLCKVPDTGNRNFDVGKISKQLKELAKRVRCPVLVGAQLNRACERRGKERGPGFGDYKPILSDLNESGSIEADADVIVFLSRQDLYDDTRPGTADIGIAKNRDSATGWTEMLYSKQIVSFQDKEVI